MEKKKKIVLLGLVNYFYDRDYGFITEYKNCTL